MLIITLLLLGPPVMAAFPFNTANHQKKTLQANVTTSINTPRTFQPISKKAFDRNNPYSS